MNVRVTIISLGLIAFFSVPTQCFNPAADHGEYVVNNEGLSCYHYDNQYVKVDAEIVRKDCYEKVYSANVTVKQKLGPIALKVLFKKLDKYGNAVDNTEKPNFIMDNACEAGFDENLFMEHFIRCDKEKDSINMKKCTVSEGSYQLRQWTVEPHIKKGLGKHFFYGKFNFSVTISGKPKGSEEEIEYLTVGIQLSIVNKEMEDHRRKSISCDKSKPERRNRERGKKSGEGPEDHPEEKKGPEDKKGPEEKKDPKDSKTWSDPNQYQDPNTYDPTKYGGY